MSSATKAIPLVILSGTRLAVLLLFSVMWGTAGMDKLRTGIPSWFGDKFGKTFLATFPGLTATFWILTAGEILGLALCLISLARLEFLPRRQTPWLQLMLVWSLFLFVQLGLGQWITSEFNATFMLFTYFCGTLLALHHIQDRPQPEAGISN